jgi:predicted acetyltransferase
MSHDHKSLPIDAASAKKLAAGNLRMELVDTGDAAKYETWARAGNRGFHGPELTEEHAVGMMAGMVDRRTTGVYDGDEPVGTVNAFPSPLTVPGGAQLPAWAISMVTVAPTHRRRGIARELLESELRTAVALGIPMAMLTVSESTIYSRFGFAPAVLASNVTINTRRARYIGPTPGGSVRFISVEELRPLVDELYARWRVTSPGEIEVWPRRWDQIIGLTDDAKKDVSKLPRAVRYDDADGVLQGFAVYKVKENEADFPASTAEVHYVMTTTVDAYAAIWRFLLELDLVATVTAHLRPVDEPVRWQVSDFRAVKVETHDHLWLRILDVPTVLQARQYYAPANLVLEITDDVGHAGGTFLFNSENPSVEPVESTPALTMSINELSALYLGGVSAVTLHKAGRITEHEAGAVEKLDAAFRSPATPWLSVWF